MNADTLQWLEKAPLQGLQCRDLRHAWPRAQSAGNARSLQSTADITWRRLSPAGGPAELERSMHCTGRCGTVRTETFLLRAGGRMVRIGKPRYRRDDPAYLRRRSEPGVPLEPLDPDELRATLVRRMYPRLQW